MRLRRWLGLGMGMGCAAVLPCACTPADSQLPQLLAREIQERFPDYEVVAEPGERLCVHRPFRRDVFVDTQRMAEDCRAGPEACGQSTQAMMESLR